MYTLICFEWETVTEFHKDGDGSFAQKLAKLPKSIYFALMVLHIPKGRIETVNGLLMLQLVQLISSPFPTINPGIIAIGSLVQLVRIPNALKMWFGFCSGATFFELQDKRCLVM